jgi:hypothetical protein
MTYDHTRLAIVIALFLGALIVGGKLFRPRVLSASLVFGCVFGIGGSLVCQSFFEGPRNVLLDSLLVVVFTMPFGWVFLGMSLWSFLEAIISRSKMFSLSDFVGLTPETPTPQPPALRREIKHRC